MGVSSGFVLDSANARSLQTDIIIHERSCPRFRLGQDDDFEYFPCEGVAAVGEVKTTLTKAELEDCYKKVASVKALHRKPGRNSYRKYGSTMPVYGERSNALDRANPDYQILGFALFKKMDFQPQTMMEHIRRMDAEAIPGEAPSMFICLDGGVFIRMKQNGDSNVLTHDVRDCTHVVHLDFGSENFSFLVNQLTDHVVRGTTTAESPISPYLAQFKDMRFRSSLPLLNSKNAV